MKKPSMNVWETRYEWISYFYRRGCRKGVKALILVVKGRLALMRLRKWS